MIFGWKIWYYGQARHQQGRLGQQFMALPCSNLLPFYLLLFLSLILHSYWCFSSSAKTQAWLDNATGTTGPSSFGNGVSTEKVTTTSYSSWCLKVMQWVFIPLQVFIYNFFKHLIEFMLCYWVYRFLELQCIKSNHGKDVQLICSHKSSYLGFKKFREKGKDFNAA